MRWVVINSYRPTGTIYFVPGDLVLLAVAELGEPVLLARETSPWRRLVAAIVRSHDRLNRPFTPSWAPQRQGEERV